MDALLLDFVQGLLFLTVANLMFTAWWVYEFIKAHREEYRLNHMSWEIQTRVVNTLNLMSDTMLDERKKLEALLDLASTEKWKSQYEGLVRDDK